MSIYNQSLALLTDFYQLSMSYGYWKAGLDQRESVFHLFFAAGPFMVATPLPLDWKRSQEFLENFRFDQSDVDYLATLRDRDGEPYFC